MPIGPVNLICIQRTLHHGRLAGFVSGLGAACADAVYGLVAIVGLTWLSNLISGSKLEIHALGSAFLVVLGIITFIKKPSLKVKVPDARKLAGAFASTFFVAMANPSVIFTLAAIFAWAGIADLKGDHPSSAMLVSGIFLGAAAWWLALSTAVNILRKKFSPKMLLWINRIFGLIIIVTGLAFLAGARK